MFYHNYVFIKQPVYKNPSDHKLLSNFQELALFD